MTSVHLLYTEEMYKRFGYRNKWGQDCNLAMLAKIIEYVTLQS